MPINFVSNRRFWNIWRYFCDHQNSLAIKGLYKENGYESILAEKLETTLSRNIANKRPRDFYDIYILYTLRRSDFEPKILKSALDRTVDKRGSFSVLKQYESIISDIRNNSVMQNYWMNYQKEFDYAKGISFEVTCDAVQNLMKEIILIEL